MSNERKLRLIQVAKEFKVGLNTITDFLQKKGIKTDGSPNTLVDAETYAVLEKEFGGSRITGNERESIRERISQKQATITLEEAQKQTREEEQEVIIKSNVISVKDEIQQPKFLGKIDLSPKPKAAPAPAAAPKAAAGAAGAVTVKAPMPGNILDVKVQAGASVKAGDVLVILEAMKMENEILAPQDGTVASVNVNKGDTVNSGDVLVSMN